MTSQPSLGDFTWSNHLVDAVVIEIGVLGDAEPDVAARESRHVVGVSVVEGVIGRYDGDLVTFGPAQTDEAEHEWSVGVNDVELLLTESS